MIDEELSPSPWKFESTSEGDRIVDSKGDDVVFLDRQYEAGDDRILIGQADGRLIAAAPELLKWLKNVMLTDFTGLREGEGQRLIEAIEGPGDWRARFVEENAKPPSK